MNVLSFIKNRHLITIITLIVFSTGCSQNPAKKIANGIDLYINGEAEKGFALIEDGIINSSLIKKIRTNNFSFGENVLFHRQNTNFNIIWPIELDIEIDEKYKLISFSPETNKIGLSNGYDIKLYDIKGKLLKTISPVQDDKRIKALTLINELIYYYKDKKVFIFDPSTDTEKQLSTVKTKLPFENESYDAEFYKTDNGLAAVAGIAGRYYLSIYDLKNNTVILANHEITASKLLYKNDEIYYVKGSAGSYTIVKKSTTGKMQKNLMGLKNIKDLEFLSNGMFIEDKDGHWFAGYENIRQKIPFRYELHGQCGGNPVFSYANNYYLIDAGKFIDTLNQVKEKAPSVFDI